MDKRLLLALPLCFAILFGWTLLFPPPKPAKQAAPPSVSTPAGVPAPTGASTSTPLENAPATPAPVGPVVGETSEKRETFVVGAPGDPGYFRATISNRGAVLEELRTGNYFDRAALSAEEKADFAHWRLLVQLLPTRDEGRAPFELRASPSAAALVRGPLEKALGTLSRRDGEHGAVAIECTLAPGSGFAFVKRWTFDPAHPDLRFEFEVANESDAATLGRASFVLTPAAGVPNNTGDATYLEPSAIAAAVEPGGTVAVPSHMTIDDSGDPRSGPLNIPSPPLVFAGVHNKYFAVLLRAADEASQPSLVGASWRRVYDQTYAAKRPEKADRAWKQIETDVQIEIDLPRPGERRTLRYDVYAGPKDDARLAAALPAHTLIIQHDLGMVSPIASVLNSILRFFHWATSSWGFAIILLTFAVRLILFPINRRSQTAMARFQTKMRRIQPKIDEVKKRYENDPKKLREEQTRIMQKEGAFPPLGGCVPPLLQIPVFIGLYRAIGVSFDLHQASFLGIIPDLALPDGLIPLGITLPFFGTIAAINVLPPMMVAMWIWQQRSMPVPTDPQQAQMHKMMVWMPLLFGVLLYNYAAGLSLYMITNSALAMLEMRWINKKLWPMDETEQPSKKGFMSKLMAAAEEQQRLKRGQHENQAKARARR